MGKINFEEYRQPWETGPHWELKREFIEKYQDDFPEDRLLCLAQAYSNIELLHCSYPDPVMLQIHELSKALQGCKRFREVKKNFPKDEPELQARKGKRSAPDDMKKPFKFIKFYSVGTDEATDDSAFGDNVSVDTPKSETPSTSSLNVPSVINSTSTLESSDCSTKPKLLIMSLSQSPDFKLITEIAAERENLQIKSTHATEEIERVVESLNLQKQVHYKFENVAVGNKLACLCKFYIGDTLLSIGRCANERSSRLTAAAYAMESLINVSNLPVKALNDLKSTTDEESICFLHKFLQEITKANRAKLSSTEKIISAVASLKCESDVTYFSREDLESPLNFRLYYNDLVIKKILICTGQSTGKKKAKSAAADQVIPLLVQFFNALPEDSNFKVLGESSNIHTSEDPISSAPLKTDTFVSTSNSQPNRNNVNLKQSSVKDPNTNIVGSPSVNPGDFRINYRLLNNSLEKHFVILDTSAITPDTQIHTPQKTLTHSAQYCKIPLVYEMSDRDPIQDGPSYRCDLMLDGENMGFGAGSTKSEAKTTATIAALQSLEKHFYTIKVKSELDESFVIKRNQMMNTNVATDAVSDSNVGCRMLKMMGWTGGGIGKTGGITEPIKASEHRFHQGLGFANNNGEMKKFQQNIESLLREFSQTDTTSDLIFATDFTKDERKIIHKIAIKFGLIGNSKGKNNQRQLFVKHKLTTTELLNHLIRAGGSTSKYELVDKST